MCERYPPLPGMCDVPVGVGSDVVCDRCMKTVATSPNSALRAGELDQTALAYATKTAGVWSLRRLNCMDCGHIDGPYGADAVVAVVRFRYDASEGQHRIATARRAPGYEHHGTRRDLRREEL